MPDEILPPPVPIEYASPLPKRSRKILSARIALHVWAIAGAMLMTSCFAVPQFEQVFKDFRVELPAITQITLLFSRALSNDYLWIPFTLLAIVLPFGLTALLQIGTPTPAEVKRREVLLSRGLRVLALVVILWMALAMFQPYVTLIQTISGPSGKR